MENGRPLNWHDVTQSGRGSNVRQTSNVKTTRKPKEVRLCFIFEHIFYNFFFVVAFAEIDWHDYAIVQTIEFTAADANSELPPPMSVQEVENMTLAQKRMAAMIMENTADDVEAHRAKQAAADAASGNNDDMEVDDEKEAEERRKKEEAERLREIERARALQASSMNAGGAVKIRTDYVPKGKHLFL